jgi:hypothetical protein
MVFCSNYTDNERYIKLKKLQYQVHFLRLALKFMQLAKRFANDI